MFNDAPLMFNGIRVVVIQDQPICKPNMQLSPRVCEVLSPAMVAETNRWMFEFFGHVVTGYWNPVDDGKAIVNQEENTAMMNPRTYREFIQALGKNYRR